jgi:hypothetical protein
MSCLVLIDTVVHLSVFFALCLTWAALDNQQYYTVTVHINNWFGNVNFNRWYKTADLVQAVPVLTVTESTLCCTNQSSQIDSLNSISCDDTRK